MSKDFKREGSHKKKRNPETWKRPKGRHSRVRLEKNGAPATPKVGYRTPKKVRGKHPSGFDEVIVNNSSDLEEIDSETEAVKIASKVGGKKREQIIEKADENDIKVLNRGDQ